MLAITRQRMLSGVWTLSSHRGFTLVEMMVTVSILLILMGVAVPSFTTFIHNSQVRSTAEGLLTGLYLARSEAIRRNDTVTFWMVDGLTATCRHVTNGRAWVVSSDNPAGKCNIAPSDTTEPRIVQTRNAGETGSNASVTATGGSCMTFNAFGGLEANCPESIPRFTQIGIAPPNGSAARTLQIRATAGGSIRLCDTGVSDPADPASC